MIWQESDPTARLTDPEAVRRPFETTFADAQSAVNFVVFDPGWLPADCEIHTVTVRPEQPPGRPGDVTAADIGQTPHSDRNPAALRAVIEGDGRTLRVKEFLYDWMPPSATVAPIWRTPRPEPVEVGDAVGWLGTDYKDNRGACLQRERSQIELSVLEGTFADDELGDILEGLIPADDSGANAVRRAPFHDLSYWARRRCEGIQVPHRLWALPSVRPYHESHRLSQSALRQGTTPVPALVPDSGHFAFDSAVAFPTIDAVESVYRHRANASDHLWLTAAAVDSPLAPADPPQAQEQPAERRETVELRGTQVHYANVTEAQGGWGAVWTADGTRYVALAGSSQHLDGAGVRAVIDELAVTSTDRTW